MFSFDVRNLAGEIAQEYAKRQVRHLANLHALTAVFSVLFLVMLTIANLFKCYAYR